MSKEIIIGIDGGLNGGICVLKGKKIEELLVMPTVAMTESKREYDYRRIIEILNDYPDATVILEKAHAMPKLGTVQAFRFGLCYGAIIGMLAALKMRYHIVHSQRWQRTLLADQPKGDTKAASKIVAQRLFPDQDFTATARSVKLHDGLTDAALIAYYGQNHL